MSRTQIRGSTRIKDATVTVAKLATEDGATWKIAGDNKGIIDGLGMPTTANQAANKAYVDNFVVQQSNNGIIYATTDPTISENPATKDVIWVNTDSGKIFTCIDNTTDDNKWQGTAFSGLIESSTLNIVDFFGDESGIALYQLDDNANDTGGIHNGEEHNVDYDTGKFVDAVKFKGRRMGANTYNNGIHLDGTVTRDKTIFTLSCWIKGTGIILQSDYYGDSRGWATGWAIFTNKVDKAISEYKIKTVKFNSADTATFHHFCAVIDHTDKAKIYIDGALLASGDISGGVYYNGSYYADTGENIGSAYNNGFKGLIDQVRIFNRALTDDEITQLYQEK